MNFTAGRTADSAARWANVRGNALVWRSATISRFWRFFALRWKRPPYASSKKDAWRILSKNATP